MSYILESIKQAERERKAGNQAPSISIEYTGEHIEDIEGNKIQWLMLALGLIATAIVVWGATYYFANKDHQYIAEISVPKVASSQVKPVNNKRDVALKPVENIHTSNLKSVKVIDDEEIFFTNAMVETGKQSELLEKSQSNNETIAAVKTTLDKPNELPMGLSEIQADEIKTIKYQSSEDSNKHDLAAIYSDLAKLNKQESKLAATTAVNQEAILEQEQIETIVATSVKPEIKTQETQVLESKAQVTKVNSPASTSAQTASVYKQQHEQAVSSGVPSFGELPYDIQERIPDFNVSVHMFHTDPLQRRIRINGQMYTEGKSLQQDLALVEITRYGAVFDYQGHKFRFNVR